MDLDVALKMVLRNKAMDECFNDSYFNICPIIKIHNGSYPNRSILFKAHCVHFEDMTEEMIVELKSLVREAVYYEKPWWKIF